MAEGGKPDEQEFINIIDGFPTWAIVAAFITGAALVVAVAFILEKREAASNGDT